MLNIFFKTEGQIFFFLFYLHLFINSFVLKINEQKFNIRFFEKFGNSILFLIPINLIISLIFYSISNFLIELFISLLIILIVTEINLYLEYKIFITSDIFILLFETNKNETNEFLKELFSFRILKNLLISLIFFVLTPFIFAKYSYIFLIPLLKYDISQYFTAILMLIFFFFFLRTQKAKKRIKYYCLLPFFRIYREFLIAKKQNKKNLNALKYQKELENKIPNLKIKNNEIENLIFIIGESASKNYLEIYNSYSSYLKNSPNMTKLKENGDLFLFDNIISPDSFTAFVIPTLMTFKNYENKKEWYHCTNLISILKRSGFTTYWLSNQGKNETLSKVFSSLADKTFFAENFIEEVILRDKIKDFSSDEIFLKEGKSNRAYDEILISEGFKILENKKKRAIFIHLQGSHSDYNKRYPKKWNIDTHNDIKGNQTKKMKKYIAEYSNSLRYTDYILEQIFSYFSKEKSFYLYLSDHAEELREKRDVRGHTSNNGSKYMVEIPFFIMISKKLQKIYPNLVEICKKRVHKAYMTDDIIHTILGVLGINYSEYEEERDLFSKKFNENRKRMYQGKDYDIFWKNQF